MFNFSPGKAPAENKADIEALGETIVGAADAGGIVNGVGVVLDRKKSEAREVEKSDAIDAIDPIDPIVPNVCIGVVVGGAEGLTISSVVRGMTFGLNTAEFSRK